MITSETDVIQSLQTSVIAAVAQSTYPTLPIKFLNVTDENIPIPPVDGGPWLELIWIPNNPSDTTWGDEKVYRGIFRMLLHWPNDGGGSYGATGLMESIKSVYRKGIKLGGKLDLLTQPRLFSVGDPSKELQLIVSFEYSSFSP